MDALEKQASESTPLVKLDPSGKLEIRGESYPENTFEFYSDIQRWIEDFIDVTTVPITIEMELPYFNSSSSKVLLDLFEIFDEAAENGRAVVINWHYHEENDLAEEHGEEFAEDLENATFNLCPFGD